MFLEGNQDKRMGELIGNKMKKPDGRRERTFSLSGRSRSMKNVAVLRFFGAPKELEKSSTDVFQSPSGKRFVLSDLRMFLGNRRIGEER